MNFVRKIAFWGLGLAALATVQANASAIYAVDADDTTAAISSFPPVWDQLVFGPPSDVSVFLQSSTANGDGDGNLDGDIDSALGRAWGLHAGEENLVGPSQVRLGHTLLGGALTPGQTFSIDMDNGLINPNGLVGVELDADGFDRLIFQFRGGLSNYEFGTLAGGFTDSGIGFSDEGLHLRFTLQDADTIDLRVTTIGNGNVFDFNGIALGGPVGTDIDRIEIFNLAAGNGMDKDAFFNNLSVVPEPGTASLLLAGLLGLALKQRRSR